MRCFYHHLNAPGGARELGRCSGPLIAAPTYWATGKVREGTVYCERHHTAAQVRAHDTRAGRGR